MRQNISVVAVFLSSILLTLLTWYHAQQNIEIEDRFVFDEIANGIEDSVADRMQIYINMLEQARSTFMLDENVTPEEWRNYVNSLQTATRYPGIQGLGFAKALRPENLQEEIARLRRTPGFEAYEIWPAGEREVYFPIVMLEPMDWRNQRALGFDMFTEDIRRNAMVAARDLGHTRMTGVVTLVQETDKDPQPGFLIYAPVYKAGLPLSTPEERSAALMGFVYSPFRAQDLFASIFQKLRPQAESGEIDFEISAASDEKPGQQVMLYDHDPAHGVSERQEAKVSGLQRQTRVAVAGQNFTIGIYSNPGFQRSGDYLVPSTILAVGLALTLLLTRIFWVYTRQAELAMKSERQLRLVTDSLPVLISYIDPQLKFRFNNLAYETWFGTPPSQLIGVSMREAIGAENFTMVEEAVRAALGGKTSTAEYEVKLKDGRVRACQASYIPDRGPHGIVKGVVGLVSDVADRKKSEEQATVLLDATTALHISLESESALKNFSETLVPQFADWVAIDLLDSETEFTRVAAAHASADGLQALLEIARNHPQTKNSAAPHRRALIEGEPQLIAEAGEDFLSAASQDPAHLQLIKRIGVSSAIVAPLSIRGRNLGAITVGRASAHRPYDNEDLKFAVELGRRAALAIENARLFRDAQAANRSKDEFLATVSHELRTPMNVILGWLEILQTEKPQGQALDLALATLERNARVQIELINDLLDISRIISGKLNIAPKNLKIVEVIRLAVESVRPAARAKAIRLEASIDPQVTQIQADPDRLNQVLWNLLTNAIKFTPNGGSVEVRVKAADQGVRIEVADTGQGIEPRFLPFVFDRFRQEDGSTTRHHGGLGIGLAIVRYLVELHGGQVEVASPGKGFGATFSVFIPSSPTAVADPAAEEPTAAYAYDTQTVQAAPQKPARGPTPLRDIDILLVDDSPDVRTLLSRVLSKAGANVHALSSAPEALETLKRSIPDVLLSDIGLPEMDGYELIRKIRANEARKGLPPLPSAALTAYAQSSDAEAAIAAGYDRHLPKPVSADELIETVLALAQMRPPPETGVPMLQGL